MKKFLAVLTVAGLLIGSQVALASPRLSDAQQARVLRSKDVSNLDFSQTLYRQECEKIDRTTPEREECMVEYNDRMRASKGYQKFDASRWTRDGAGKLLNPSAPKEEIEILKEEMPKEEGKKEEGTSEEKTDQEKLLEDILKEILGEENLDLDAMKKDSEDTGTDEKVAEKKAEKEEQKVASEEKQQEKVERAKAKHGNSINTGRYIGSTDDQSENIRRRVQLQMHTPYTPADNPDPLARAKDGVIAAKIEKQEYIRGRGIQEGGYFSETIFRKTCNQILDRTEKDECNQELNQRRRQSRGLKVDTSTWTRDGQGNLLEQ